MYTAHLEYATQLGVLSKDATQGLLSLVMLSFVRCHGSEQFTWQEKPTFLVVGRNNPLLNIIKDLDIDGFLDMRKYRKCNLYEKVVEGSCVCKSATSGKVLRKEAKWRSTFPYFDIINDMLGHVSRSMGSCM